MKMPLTPLAAALCATVLVASTAHAFVPATCYQTGLIAGCAYLIRYDNGEVVVQTADAQGRVTRPCNRIITGVERDHSRSCGRVQPITPPES